MIAKGDFELYIWEQALFISKQKKKFGKVFCRILDNSPRRKSIFDVENETQVQEL